jgi:hypothetical protein
MKIGAFDYILKLGIMRNYSTIDKAVVKSKTESNIELETPPKKHFIGSSKKQAYSIAEK